MNKEARKIIEELTEIKQQWETEVDKKRTPWPRSIKERVFRLIELNISRKKISELSGVPYHTINFWHHHKSAETPEVVEKFHSLSVHQREMVTVTPPTVGTVTVKTQNGIELEGNAKDILFLIKNLGGIHAL